MHTPQLFSHEQPHFNQLGHLQAVHGARLVGEVGVDALQLNLKGGPSPRCIT